jgi:hypothetical protein
MKSALTVVAFALVAVGCTDTERSSWGALGNPAHITCWSGTLKTYEGDSTGRVAATNHSDGWEFREAGTGKFVRVSGACLVKN